jgi:hypothetical protein
MVKPFQKPLVENGSNAWNEAEAQPVKDLFTHDRSKDKTMLPS